MGVKSCVLGALVLGWVLSSQASAAPLVTNGGFETGVFTGWTVTGADVFTGVDGLTTHSGDFGSIQWSTHRAPTYDQPVNNHHGRPDRTMPPSLG